MKRRAFTLIEVLVVVAIIALLIAILMPSLARAREVSMRSVCLSNEHQLALAWTTYQIDNKGALVGGSAQSDDPAYLQTYAPSFVCIVAATPPDRWTIAEQEAAIRKGALCRLRYLRSPSLFHCPATQRNEYITYASTIPMNSPYDGSFPEAVKRGCFVHKMADIGRPSDRIVYLDHIPADWDFSWTTQDINVPRFWDWGGADYNYTDRLSGRHTKGTVYVFSDGHSEYWRWFTVDMRRFAMLDYKDRVPYPDFGNTNMKNNLEFIRLFRGVWGHRFHTSLWP